MLALSPPDEPELDAVPSGRGTGESLRGCVRSRVRRVRVRRSLRGVLEGAGLDWLLESPEEEARLDELWDDDP